MDDGGGWPLHPFDRCMVVVQLEQQLLREKAQWMMEVDGQYIRLTGVWWLYSWSNSC